MDELPKKQKVAGIGCLLLIIMAIIGVTSVLLIPSSKPAFNVSRHEIFQLLASPNAIEPTVLDADRYAILGWQRSDLQDGTPRWLAKTGIYLYELIGDPPYKLSLLAGMTGEFIDTAELLVRSAVLVRCVGVPKSEAGIVIDLIVQALDEPNEVHSEMIESFLVTTQFLKEMPIILISVEAVE